MVFGHANFRVSMSKSDHYGIYDLIIDSGKNTDPVKDINALYNYLHALTGNA